MRRYPIVRALTVSVLIVAGAVVPAARLQAAAKPSSLRLMSVMRHITIERFPDTPDLTFSPGMYVAAVRGSFEIHAIRGPRGVVTLWQIQRDAKGPHRIRRITPAGLVTLDQGLPRFFKAELRTASGEVVSVGTAPFCPSGGYGFARTSASGPTQPTFPYSCGSQHTRAAVWGIDNGWAAPMFVNVPTPEGPDGEYKLTVRIADTYVKQLGIDPKQTTVNAGVTLTTSEGGPGCGPRVCIGAPRTRGALNPERPRNVLPAESSGTKGLRGAGLPDLMALPAHNLETMKDEESGKDYLNFGATVWNGGGGPLVVEGFRSNETPFMNATQFIYANGRPIRSAGIGRLEYDPRPGHQHWHMQDIALYELLDANGRNALPSGKQAFCLAPTDAVDLTGAGAEWQPDRLGLFSACGGEDSIWLREVLSAGWGDTYYQGVPGQNFDITKLANGRYRLRITTNIARRILEANYKNNVSIINLELGGTAGERTVKML